MINNLDSYNLYLFKEGKLNKAYDIFGSHINKDESGSNKSVTFRVFAPNAKEVSVVGDFNNWDKESGKLLNIDNIGVFEGTFENAKEWDKYKYFIKTSNNDEIFKADPYAFFSEYRPETCSRIYDIDSFKWHDTIYLKERLRSDIIHEPLSIYEMNIGSWMIKKDGSFNNYTELVDLLIPYLVKMGFNAVEFMPLVEFPLDESWGYQGTGYYSITSRYGSPKDLMYLIDNLHLSGIKVIMDWVPGHISKDSHGLSNFDGTHLYEFDDIELRENVTWGTVNLDFNKGHTESYLLSNAMFFLEYFHIDGFRLDAVSNLYYYLGDQNRGENTGGIKFLKDLSLMIKEYDKNIIISAEDSTIYPNVTKRVEDGGIGFDFKWNMGWMNDTLKYFSKDPIYRKYHHNNLTFSLIYAFSENFILPFSHDEVVHGKLSLVDKMPGDYFSKFANYRALLGYMFMHPGKKLLFMGSEFAQFKEWNDKDELDWFLLQYPKHSEVQRYVRDLNNIYKYHDALYLGDDNKESFKWIDPNNSKDSIISFLRISNNETLLCILNLTPNVHENYRFGCPSGEYVEILNSDKDIYGGSNLYNGLPIKTENINCNNYENSISVLLSPLSIAVFKKK